MEGMNMPSREGKSVLLMVDFDNVFHSLYNVFGPEKFRLEERIQAMMQWIATIGPLLGGNGWVFAPLHISHHFRELFVKQGFNFQTCPKIDDVIDVVDEKIMEFGKLQIAHPEVGCICVVSGDSDFIPLFEEAKSRGIKTALVIPTLQSVSADKVLISLPDPHPITGEPMIFRLDEVATAS